MRQNKDKEKPTTLTLIGPLKETEYYRIIHFHWQGSAKVNTKHIPQHILALCCAWGKWEKFQSGLYLQITEIVGAIVNLVDGELKNVTPTALQWNAALSPIRVRSRCKAWTCHGGRGLGTIADLMICCTFTLHVCQKREIERGGKYEKEKSPV